MDWSRARKLFRRTNTAASVVLLPAHIVQAYLVICAIWSWLVTWYTAHDAALNWTRLDEVKLFFAVAIITTLIAAAAAAAALWIVTARQRWLGIKNPHDSALATAIQMPSDDPRPPKNLASRLYVGEMGVDANKLQAERVLEIWIRCFNATGHALWAHRIVGNTELRWSESGSTNVLGKLPPPTILSDRSKTENLEDATEMFFVLEQRIPEQFIEKLLTVSDTASAHLMFADSLSIVLGSHDAATLRLNVPLWGGIRVYRSSTQFLSSRILIVKMKPITLSLN